MAAIPSYFLACFLLFSLSTVSPRLVYWVSLSLAYLEIKEGTDVNRGGIPQA